MHEFTHWTPDSFPMLFDNNDMDVMWVITSNLTEDIICKHEFFRHQALWLVLRFCAKTERANASSAPLFRIRIIAQKSK